MEILDIPQVEKQYQDEWLLFEVYETDELNRPVKGKLLAHSPSRAALDEYWEKKVQRCHHSYVVYTGEKPKKGMAVVLCQTLRDENSKIKRQNYASKCKKASLPHQTLHYR